MSESNVASRWLDKIWLKNWPGRSRLWAVLTSLLLLATSAAPEARAEGARIVFANDFLTSNRLTDDLYTGALELELEIGRYQLTFGENVFTDSENGIRFDETFLGVERGLPAVGAWRSTVELGVMHVGRGLLGENAQNSLHRLIGSDQVDLPYVESNRFHPTLRLRFHRPLPYLRQLSLTAYGELYSAFDFRQHASGAVKVHWPRWSFASIIAGLGARYSTTSFEALEPRIGKLAPTWEVGIRFRNNMSVSWSYNDFGTESQHFAIGYDLMRKKGVRSGLDSNQV